MTMMDLSTREILEKSEQEIRKARSDREHALREDDKATRAKLERQSASGSRRGLVSLLNAMEYGRAAVASPDLGFLTKLRDDQQLARRTPQRHNREHAKFEKAQAAEGFNRLHPSSPLSRGSGFDFRSDDPGMSGRSNFGQWDRFAPPQRGEDGSGSIVPDAAGSLQSDDPRARDHWSSGRVEAIQAAFLLEATRLLVEAIRTQRANFPKGRRDD